MTYCVVADGFYLNILLGKPLTHHQLNRSIISLLQALVGGPQKTVRPLPVISIARSLLESLRGRGWAIQTGMVSTLVSKLKSIAPITLPIR